MVDGVFRWVRGIVAVVLTMTFIEMVVPRSELKKYVDVVVGLAVIGAILTPLLGLGVGIGTGLELAAEATRSWPASWRTAAQTGAPPGLHAELASSVASRALEARVRKALSSSYGGQAEGWTVRVCVTDSGQLASAEVDTGFRALSGRSGSPGPEDSLPAAVDRAGVARTVALALDSPLQLVTVR